MQPPQLLKRRAHVAVVVVALLALAAGAVALARPAGRGAGADQARARSMLVALGRPRTLRDRLPSAAARAAPVRLEAGSSRRVVARAGYRVYVAASADRRLLCLVTASAAGEVGTSCSPPSAFVAPGFAFVIRDHGPATPPFAVLGVVARGVQDMVLTYEQGARRLAPAPDGGFVSAEAGLGRLETIASVGASGRRVGSVTVPPG